jgi:hypothetical protein
VAHGKLSCANLFLCDRDHGPASLQLIGLGESFAEAETEGQDNPLSAAELLARDAEADRRALAGVILEVAEP